MKRQTIEQASAELNNVLGLVPTIDVTASTDDLLHVIKKVSPLVVQDDIFSNNVVALLVDLDALTEETESAFSMSMSFDTKTEAEDTKPARKSKAKAKPKAKKTQTRTKKPHIIEIENMIAENRYTAKQIINRVTDRFDKKRATIQSYVRGAKNSKYSVLNVPVVEDPETKILRFDTDIKSTKE